MKKKLLFVVAIMAARVCLLAIGVSAEEKNPDYNADYVKNCQRGAEAREYTRERLNQMGFETTDSKANFIFAKSPDIGGEQLYLELKSRGILVRHFSTPSICEYNRITVGTREQMDVLLTEISNILSERISK